MLSEFVFHPHTVSLSRSPRLVLPRRGHRFRAKSRTRRRILGGDNFGVCLEFSGGLSQARPIDVVLDVGVDGAKSVAQFDGGGWLIGRAERRE